jgi:hypothetical protein
VLDTYSFILFKHTFANGPRPCWQVDVTLRLRGESQTTFDSLKQLLVQVGFISGWFHHLAINLSPLPRSPLVRSTQSPAAAAVLPLPLSPAP